MIHLTTLTALLVPSAYFSTTMPTPLAALPVRRPERS